MRRACHNQKQSYSIDIIWFYLKFLEMTVGSLALARQKWPSCLRFVNHPRSLLPYEANRFEALAFVLRNNNRNLAPMRVTDRSSTAPIQGSASTQRATAASSRFTLGSPDATGKTASTQSTAPAGAMEGLLALQAVGDVLERRKRAMRRGHNLLDSLDKLKLSLLSGRVSASSLEILSAQLKQKRDTVDDPQLEDILAHVELRAEVEIAKLALK
jgi:Class II flagellar assembly regulator